VVLATSPVPVENLTVADDNHVYFTHKADLYRVVEPLEIRVTPE